MKVYIPGVSGSMGECVVCGKSFVSEVLAGKKIDMMRVRGIDTNLPLHRKCKKSLPSDGDWKKLPEGPLRREFEMVANKTGGLNE